MLAVDAGIHLAGIIRIFEKHTPDAIRCNGGEQILSPSAAFSQMPSLSSHRPSIAKPFSPVTRTSDWASTSHAQHVDSDAKLVMTSGPFKDLLLPCEDPKANASLLLRNMISTYLITHPHLDHLSGFAINTAAFHNTSRPKKVAALPWCIDAIKDHIFNDVIWPNLSDEEGGVGFVSFTRLIEGGNVALGDGEGRGYIEVCEGLEVKCWAVSHGHCMKKHVHRGSQDLAPGLVAGDRRPSRQSIAATPDSRGNFPHSELTPRLSQTPCVIDSAAYFIRCAETAKEVLIFGDVEPDSISLSPRNARVWDDAAPKIASGILKAIFIECSYDDSQTDETLFGHLAPRHLAEEMRKLAGKVSVCKTHAARADESSGDAESIRKRKRQNDGLDAERRRGRPSTREALQRNSTSLSPMSGLAANGDEKRSYHVSAAGNRQKRSPRPRTRTERTLHDRPLAGLKVVVIHIKEALTDSIPVAQIIIDQLRAYEKQDTLGVEYIIPSAGGSIYI